MMRSGISDVHPVYPKSREQSSQRLQLPLGTAIQDANVERRTKRVIGELVDALPEIEEYESVVMDIVSRALSEQDRASRMNEAYGRAGARLRRGIQPADDGMQW